MDEPKPISRYARACRECATTKARCIRKASDLKCERCTRLNKECEARATSCRAPRRPKPNRLTQMEQKLDGLVTLLAASHTPSQPSTAPDLHSFLTPDSLSPPPPDTLTSQFGPNQIPLAPVVPRKQKTQKCPCSDRTTRVGSSNENVMRFMTPSMDCQDTLPRKVPHVLSLDDGAAAALLANYQNSMAAYFPFVVIPSNITAQHLRASKPFLFLSIMAVSSFQKTGQHTTLSADILRRLGEQMLSRGEKSLDLLQGVLVYAEWHHSHRLADPQLTNIMQLSIALLVDLGLNRACHTSDRHSVIADTTKSLPGDPICSQVRSNDERRAFLGCFYLTSIMSSCFKKLDAIRYTSHAEESCNALSQTPELESDLYLVQLVKLQQLAEQITQTLPYDAPQSFWTSKPPIGMFVKVFQSELQALKDSLPQNLKFHPTMLLHIQSVEIHLFEISLSDQSHHQASISSLFSSTSRIESLHSALLAAASFLNDFLSIPVSSYSSFPFTIWAQILHAMQVLSKLSLLTGVPGWGLQDVRNVMDFATLLDRLTERFNEARILEEGQHSEKKAEPDPGLLGSRCSTTGCSGSRYDMYVQRIDRVRKWYREKTMASPLRGDANGASTLQDQGGVDEGATATTTTAAVVGTVVDDGGGGEHTAHAGSRDDLFLLPTGPLDQFDDAYWQDFLWEWGSF